MQGSGEPPAAAALARMLQDMGLSRAEVRIYRFLAERGGAGGSAIANQTGTPRGRIYETMRQMAAKGFVREEPTSPIRFVATPESEVLALAKARFTRHLATIKTTEAMLSGAAAAIRPSPDPLPARPRDVRVLDGRRACNAELLRMLAQTRGWFWLTGSARFAHRLSQMPRLQEALRVAATPDVDVRLFLADAGSRTPSMLWLRMSLDRLIHDIRLDTAHAQILTCANETSVLEILVQPNDDAPSRGNDVGIRVNSRALADATRYRMESMNAKRTARQTLESVPPAATPEAALELPSQA